ncbi:type I-B CRISPR-associated protein Cas5 [Bacillaceae bacterium SIJ1]|uniref:type I-B CRISPR-associated protein Cas5b n=1 Tax=Litoribacterium kuwaitense TaxID=1398745 RepID=UPI0013EABC76|nr:type I-B CRISPR-associated protein Cas5b [Litoribacterium kuwaitense]NGP44614.1 type I-B CRISPR-associated protein Cas5 [Litoribacterium kuwaitense]
MKALRLKLYQQTACYKKPFAFKVSETYPLPPYATVKGMLHALLQATELIPMKLSIQGSYDTVISDYQTHYFFKKANTKEFALTADGLGVDRDMSDVTTMPIYTQMLYDVELLIHVQASDEVLRQLQDVIANSAQHLSLGRWEDLVRVDACEMVELREPEEDYPLKYNAYVPREWLDEGDFFPYKLNWTYRSVNHVRVWDKISVGYVQHGFYLSSEEAPFYVDVHDDVVLFPSQ